MLVKKMRWMNIYLILGGITAASAYGQPCEYQEVAKLEPAEVSSSSQYGGSIAQWGDVVIVGAQSDDVLANNSGSAFLFDAETGVELARLLALDGHNLLGFGGSVAINSTRAIVGNGWNPADSSDEGVYLFDLESGQQVFRLSLEGSSQYTSFGSRLAANDQYILASAILDNDAADHAGAVYVYDAQTLEQLWKLKLADGVEDDLFGYSIGIHGSKAIITTRVLNFDHREREGLVYVFDLVTGQQIARFAPQQPGSSTYFGSSVAINDSIVAIGLPGVSCDEGRGSVYLYDLETEARIAILNPTDNEPFWGFGGSLAMSNDMIVVGSGQVSGVHFGAAYQFDASSFEQARNLQPSDAETSIDYFGATVSVLGDRVLVGSAANDDDGGYSGSSYIFDLVCCEADLNGDGSVDFFDVSIFLTLYILEDTRIDYTQDGVIDFFDVSEFLQAFAVGCP